MWCYACVPCSSHKRFSFLERYMCSSLWVSVSFGQSKINNINHILFVCSANHKIVGLDVPMHKSLPMNGLKSINNLDSNLKYSADTKLSVMFIEQILEWVLEQIDNHKNFLPFVPIIMEFGNASCDIHTTRYLCPGKFGTAWSRTAAARLLFISFPAYISYCLLFSPHIFISWLNSNLNKQHVLQV